MYELYITFNENESTNTNNPNVYLTEHILVYISTKNKYFIYFKYIYITYIKYKCIKIWSIYIDIDIYIHLTP